MSLSRLGRSSIAVRSIALLSLSARLASGAGVAVDTGPIETHLRRGCNDRDASRLQNLTFPSLSHLGHSTSITAGIRIADDFTLLSTTLVKSITFYAYRGGTGETCTFDDARVLIWDGSPAGDAQIVFGDLVTNRLASCTFANVYRDAETLAGECDLPVMAVTATINTELPAGTYWADFELGESFIAETYVVPITMAGQEGPCGSGCNAVRFNGSIWQNLNDGSNPQDVKLVVNADTPRTIQNGNAVLARTATPFDATPSARLSGVSVQTNSNQLFEAGWAYRVSGDSRETFFPAPNSESFGGNSSQLGWTNVDGRGFSATESAAIYDTGLGAYLLLQMQLINLSAVNPLTIDLFHMADLDLDDFGDDTARMAAWTPGRIVGMEDTGGSTVADHWADTSATKFLVLPSGAGDVGAVLNDADLDNFDNSGVPFGPGDVTTGYQFPLVIPPSSTESVLAILSVNFPLQCDGVLEGLYCDGFESNDRVPWSASVP